MVVEMKNISRAAERCYISQSGMSQQLASIERELGVSLFQRINNELRPTREGEIYIRYAREILGLHARAIKELEECSQPDKGRILMGVSPERGNAMMQQIFPVFKSSYPDVQFQIIENHLYELEQMVCDNRIDLSEAAYVPQIPSSLSDQVKKIDLYAERIMMVLPRNAYFENKLERMGAEQDGSVVDLLDFQNESFILPSEVRIRLWSITDRLFKEAGFVPKVVMETSNNAMALNLVADGNYISLVPQSYYYSIYGQTDRIYYRTIRQNPYWIRALIYRKESKLTAAERRLVGLIKEYHRPIMEVLKRDNQRGPELPDPSGEME